MLDTDKMLLDAILAATDTDHESAYGPYVEGYAREIVAYIKEAMSDHELVFYQP